MKCSGTGCTFGCTRPARLQVGVKLLDNPRSVTRFTVALDLVYARVKRSPYLTVWITAEIHRALLLSPDTASRCHKTVCRSPALERHTSTAIQGSPAPFVQPASHRLPHRHAGV